MLTKNINFKNFPYKKKNNTINIFNDIRKSYFLGKEKLLLSLSDQYKYSFNLKKSKYNFLSVLAFILFIYEAIHNKLLETRAI